MWLDQQLSELGLSRERPAYVAAAGAGTRRRARFAACVGNDGSVGITIDDDLLLELANFRYDARILPRPVLGVTAQTFARERVVAVEATATEYPPARFDGTVYVRVGPSTRKASVR